MKKRMLHIFVFDKICLLITFAVFLFLHNDVGFCMMPGGNDGNVNLGMVDIYRPLVNQLPVESVDLFRHFEELGQIIQTSRLGRLPGPDEAYGLIAKLHPERLNSLINPLVEGYTRLGYDPIIQARLAYCYTELLRENTACLTALTEITHSMNAVSCLYDHPSYLYLTNNSLTLQETFSYLIRNLDFAPDAEGYYATKILVETSRLYNRYDKLLALLLAFPL